MNTIPIFDLIDRLSEARPFDPGQVAAILGTALARKPESDTPSTEVHALAAPDARFHDVDLRLPDADIGEGGGFLSVTLNGDEGLDKAAVIARYGTGFRADIPSPRFKPGTVPLYLVYERDWGELSFGVASDAAGKLVRCILSAHDHAE